MKSPKFSSKPKKSKIILLRQVSGMSMAPALKPGNYIVATSLARLKPGKVVVVHHDGKEKIKRIDSIQDDQVFLVGDNLGSSTDSRHFGALPKEAVIAVMIWPRLEWE